jgi:uncharacterized membrane protein HdeD (DUF308 family)/predicted phosphodiesterase
VLLTARRNGILLLVLGAVAMIAPLFSSTWGVAIVGGAIFFAGIIELAEAWHSDSSSTHYSSGVFSVFAGALIAMRSAFAFSGLMVVTSLVLAADGGTNVVRAVRGLSHGSRLWDFFNGAANIGLALIVWWLRDTIGVLGFGFFLGLRMAASGWQALSVRPRLDADEFARPEDEHPNRALSLPPHPIIGFIHRDAIVQAASRTPTDFYWSMIFVAVFFAIHVGRVDAEWTLLGMLTPAVATAGDIVAALVLSLVVLLPLESIFHRASQPFERVVWIRTLNDRAPDADRRWSERVVRYWAEQRLRRSVARDLENNTLIGAVRQLVRAGLPLTAVLIAVNPVWGFSWYFNSENWATAAWQKIAESRVDDWRAAMTDAAVRVRGAAGVTAPGVFEVAPAGIRDGDFSFVVIGDPGEGDPSQHALRNQVLRSARREEVKFIVIASDVIYPNGEMRDYETNFYLPMMGIDKPILAIPGNHDWFNALDGFAANLMPADTARAAIEARVHEDLNLSSTTDDRVDRLIEAAGRLRSLYRLPVGLQHAPFFEIHAGGFSLIAIDTGIKRQVDARQLEWIKAALARSAGAFTMAIVGHPFYAAGRSQIGDDGSFKELHDLLRAHGVRVMMAGDTHDFEYYREAGTHYFVNGGGGAYLSIGTALDWPERAALADYAFYPRTDAVSAKLDNETPPWKWPAWWWIRRNGAWPFSVEALSAVFDFNRAPFFQSFVEVRVERSAKRVVFAIIGVDGPLRWRDLQTGGAMMPAGQTGDDLAEIVVAIDQP